MDAITHPLPVVMSLARRNIQGMTGMQLLDRAIDRLTGGPQTRARIQSNERLVSVIFSLMLVYPTSACLLLLFLLKAPAPLMRHLIATVARVLVTPGEPLELAQAVDVLYFAVTQLNVETREDVRRAGREMAAFIDELRGIVRDQGDDGDEGDQGDDGDEGDRGDEGAQEGEGPRGDIVPLVPVAEEYPTVPAPRNVAWARSLLV